MVDKTRNSPFRAEEVTHGEVKSRYVHPQTSFLKSEISTGQAQEESAR
jgi:hypothetical protein